MPDEEVQHTSSRLGRMFSRRRLVLNLEITLLIVGVIYACLFGGSGFLDITTDAMLVAHYLVLIVGVILLCLFYFFNSSLAAAKVVFMHPKILMLLGLTLSYTSINIAVHPAGGLFTVANAIAFTFPVILVLTVDIFVKRHRPMFLGLIGVVAAITILNIYIWSFTNEEQGVVVAKYGGKIFFKRDVLRSILLSLATQILEGIVTVARARQGLSGIYVFTKEGKPRPMGPETMPRTLTSVKIATLVLVGNEAFFLTCFIAYSDFRYRSVPIPDALGIVFVVQFLLSIPVVAVIFAKNTTFSVFKDFGKQTNMWLLLLLIAGFLTGSFRRPVHALATPMIGVTIVFYVLVQISMDSLIVVARVPRMLLGTLGLLTCILGLISALVFQELDEVVLFESSTLQFTKNDVFRSFYFNWFVFLSEAIHRAFYDRSSLKLLFIRRSKFREFVLAHTASANVASRRQNFSLELRPTRLTGSLTNVEDYALTEDKQNIDSAHGQPSQEHNPAFIAANMTSAPLSPVAIVFLD